MAEIEITRARVKGPGGQYEAVLIADADTREAQRVEITAPAEPKLIAVLRYGDETLTFTPSGGTETVALPPGIRLLPADDPDHVPWSAALESP